MIHDDPNDPVTAFNVDDLVRPLGCPDVEPRRVERVITTHHDEFGRPARRTHYVVNGSAVLESELYLVERGGAAAGQGQGGPA